MTGRPGLPPNTTGKVRYRRVGDHWQAIANHRDNDGRVRQHARNGPSKSAAEYNLHRALAAPTPINKLRVRDVAATMFEEKTALVDNGDMSPGSLRTYQGHWQRYIEPELGDLLLQHVGVRRCDQFLKALRRRHSYATVKGTRSVLSEILAVAVRQELIPPPNPVESCADIPGEGRHHVKALEAGEAVHIWRLLSDLSQTPAPMVGNRQYRQTLCDPLVPDLWLWMLGTGDRISNALAVRWRYIDMTTGTARLGPNVIRVPGQGLIINEGTSKSHEVEGVDLPEQVIAMLLARQQRRDYNTMGLVFPGRFGEPRDPSNTSSKQLRPALKAIGYGHVSSHWCRRTLGSELNAAGMTLMEIAGRLRHSDSRTTERHYIAKRGGNARVKAAIEAMLATEPERRVVALDS